MIRYQNYLYLCLIVFFTVNGFTGKAQTTNPCGVVASIWPAAHDSVVPVNTIISFTNISSNATSVKWLYDGQFTGISGDLWNYQISTGVHTISLVAYNGNCTDTTTAVYFSAGTPHNIDSFLVADYGRYDINQNGTCIDNTPGGGFLMGGYNLNPNYSEQGILIKLKDRGCIDWSKYLTGVHGYDAVEIKLVYAGRDSNYYVAGTCNAGIPFLMKLDRNGNVLWTRNWLIEGVRYDIYIQYYQMTSDPAGNIYASATSYNGGLTVTKFSPSGTIIWNKYYYLGYYDPINTTANSYSNATGILWLNGKLYLSGLNFIPKDRYSTSIQVYDFVTKMDAIAGTTEWQYAYSDDGNGTQNTLMGFRGVTKYDSLIMVAGAGQGQWVTLVSPQGNVVKSIQAVFSNSYSPHQTRAESDSSGHIYIMQWDEETLPLQPYYQYFTNFAKFDTLLQKSWGLSYSDYGRGYFTDAALGNNHSFAAIGTDFGYVNDGGFASRDMRLIKVDTTIVPTDLNCNYTSPFNLTARNINRYNFNWTTDSFFIPVPVTPPEISVTDAYIQSRYLCPDFIDSCSFMKVTGQTSMCSFYDTYTYFLHRNKKCALVPQWMLPPGVSIINQTDTTISLKFPGFGQYIIGATLQSCIPIKDSLTINIEPKASKLNLGNDTVICNNTSITLHAGSSFLTYLWNTGSIDSVLTISQSGVYWVEVKDSCDNTMRDSILISPYNLPIDIGPDRAKCNNDTLHLQAPGGFISYVWSPDYNINTTSSQNVTVNPSVDTSYYVEAEKLPGCFAYDTVRIYVNKSPVINLGNDTSFCRGNNIILNAGTAFSSYQWNTGYTSQTIIVSTAGEYNVAATTPAGCISYDSLQVLNVYPNPIVSLDQTDNLCKGSGRQLDAGNFETYLWNTGSTARTIMVTAIGTYYVTVTDQNTCKGSDTTIISTLLTLPADFLPQNTQICSYGTLTIQPLRNFQNYLWSNGETGSSLNITSPGVYWLRATDFNGCAGMDTIIVSRKDCLEGFYIPNAFTPNADGINDVFKPLIFGRLIDYSFTIYNRFGQVLFKSTDINKGWDGTIGGNPQHADVYVYVWICTYQLEGQKSGTKKGTVTLLK